MPPNARRLYSPRPSRNRRPGQSYPSPVSVILSAGIEQTIRVFQRCQRFAAEHRDLLLERVGVVNAGDLKIDPAQTNRIAFMDFQISGGCIAEISDACSPFSSRANFSGPMTSAIFDRRLSPGVRPRTAETATARAGCPPKVGAEMSYCSFGSFTETAHQRSTTSGRSSS